MENAGGTVDDIGAVKIHMKDRGQREAMNKSWVKSFPEAESRPARHVMETNLGGNMQIQLEITAVIRLRKHRRPAGLRCHGHRRRGRGHKIVSGAKAGAGSLELLPRPFLIALS